MQQVAATLEGVPYHSSQRTRIQAWLASGLVVHSLGIRIDVRTIGSIRANGGNSCTVDINTTVADDFKAGKLVGQKAYRMGVPVTIIVATAMRRPSMR